MRRATQSRPVWSSCPISLSGSQIHATTLASPSRSRRTRGRFREARPPELTRRTLPRRQSKARGRPFEGAQSKASSANRTTLESAAVLRQPGTRRGGECDHLGFHVELPGLPCRGSLAVAWLFSRQPGPCCGIAARPILLWSIAAGRSRSTPGSRHEQESRGLTANGSCLGCGRRLGRGAPRVHDRVALPICRRATSSTSGSRNRSDSLQ
jgi:hypothetical protein